MVWDDGSNENTFELRRLSSISKRKNAESNFISKCFKKLKEDYPNIKLIFSYADSKAGHIGIIYQASNGIYVGLKSGKTTYFKMKDGVLIHSRTANRWKKNKNKNLYKIDFDEKIIDGFKKHLYLFILGNKDEKKKIREELKITPLPYPKSG